MTDLSFDKTELLTRYPDDMAFLRKLIQMFIDLAPKYLGDIQTAVEANNHKALESASHKLKGSVGTFAAEEAYQIAKQLELKGRNQDSEDITGLFAQMESAILRLVKDMQEFLKENT